METSTAATPEVTTQLKPELTAEDQKTELPASTGVLNTAVDKKLAQLEEEEQTHTPKLDDVSDHEPEPEISTDIETDNPAAYPASNPHIQARLEETDSLDTTPQGTQDEEMEDASGIDTTYQSNTATPEYTSFRADRARVVLDAAVPDGTPMEPSISQSSMNDETPASSEPYDEWIKKKQDECLRNNDGCDGVFFHQYFGTRHKGCNWLSKILVQQPAQFYRSKSQLIIFQKDLTDYQRLISV